MSRPALIGWGRWLVPGLVAGAALTAAILLLLFGQPLFAFGALFAGLAGGACAYLEVQPRAVPGELIMAPDYSLVGSALALSREPTALTRAKGRC